MISESNSYRSQIEHQPQSKHWSTQGQAEELMNLLGSPAGVGVSGYLYEQGELQNRWSLKKPTQQDISSY